MTESYYVGQIVTGKVLTCKTNERYLIVKLDDNQLAKLPFEEVSYETPKNNYLITPKFISSIVGKEISAEIISINNEIIISRKLVMLETFYDFNINDVVYAKVVNILRFGVFIDLSNGVISFLSVNKMSKTRYCNINNWIKNGDKIPVIITNIDYSIFRIQVSGIFSEPEDIPSNGDIIVVKIAGKVINDPTNCGYYVEISKNLAGIIDLPKTLIEKNITEATECSAIVHNIKIINGEPKLQLKFLNIINL